MCRQLDRTANGGASQRRGEHYPAIDGCIMNVPLPGQPAMPPPDNVQVPDIVPLLNFP
jgi:hypothetical protein